MTNQKKNHEKSRGPVQHAPSLKGDKTLSQLAENTNTPGARSDNSGPRYDPDEIRAHDTTGRDRLFEGREQHDDADKNSEKTRHARDVDRHHHGLNSELDERDTASRAKRKN